MGHLRGDIEVEPTRRKAVEVVREAAPVPWQALGQYDFGDVFHALHQLHEPPAVVCMAGRETDAAIAGQDRGNALARGRRYMLCPGDLGVVVGVQINEAGSNKQAAGVDFLCATFRNVADRDDPVAGNGDIGDNGRSTGAIDNGPIADDQAWVLAHAFLLLQRTPVSRPRQAGTV